jgi:two-component sensor histidine kinase
LVIDRAAPCALILHELLSNVLTHAFTDGRPGTIEVTLRRAAHQVTLSVRDTGVGLPQGLDVRHTNSLGLKFVLMLTEQLDGTISLKCDSGTILTLAFPLPPWELTR